MMGWQDPEEQRRARDEERQELLLAAFERTAKAAEQLAVALDLLVRRVELANENARAMVAALHRVASR